MALSKEAMTHLEPSQVVPPTNALTILVVEDEESFVDALQVSLEREGFRVVVARDGVEALEVFKAESPDLVLLDVMLPKLSGIDVCRAIRAIGTTPVLMVTAKTSEIDAVVGLEVGADDYIAKPFRIYELVARIRAVLRRSPVVSTLPASSAAADDDSEMLLVGDVSLDPISHEVVVRGSKVALPLKEFELLELLLENAGRVLTREVLIDRIWGHDYVGDTKTLDVHIKRLRSKVEDDPGVPTRVLTIRGLGYKYAK
jgi:two-component system, OmpR family, response regulator RegX3